MAPTHPLPTAFTEFYWVFQSQPNLTLFFLFSGTATNSDDGGAAANGASDAMVTPERCKWTSAEVKKKETLLERLWNAMEERQQRRCRRVFPFSFFKRNSFFFWLFIGFYWVFTGLSRVLPGFTGFYLVLLGFTGFYWVVTGFSWVLPSFTGFFWVLLGCYWV